MTGQPNDSVGAPAEEQPDARAKAIQKVREVAGEGFAPQMLFRREARALLDELAENQRLRKQLDAALGELREQERQSALHPYVQARTTDENTSYHDGFANAKWQTIERIDAARAALGVVAAAKLPSVDDHPGYDGDK